VYVPVWDAMREKELEDSMHYSIERKFIANTWISFWKGASLMDQGRNESFSMLCDNFVEDRMPQSLLFHC
jgi:hypothetical protein